MKKTFIPLLFSLLIFNSCLGLSIDINMNRDGSGKLTMEYRISGMLESLGALDGNEQWPAIPSGRADWERTIDRITGAKIVSFSSKKTDQDTLNTVVIEFNSAKALLAILDPAGNKSSINLDNRSGSFSYIISGGANDYIDSSGYDENLLALARTMFTDYKFSISFSAMQDSSMTITNGKGNPVTPPETMRVIPSGKKVSMTINMMDVIDTQGGLGVFIKW